MENKSRGISDSPRKLPFKLLEEITNFFSEERKLGSGTFGQVYRGVFEDGEEIAVKILPFMQGIGDQQFQNEFQLLKRLKHPNIVRLLGFCEESEETVALYEGKLVPCEKIHRALCLEYVPNGTLGKLLSGEYLGNDWHARYKIIKGICEGLKYLREGFESPIFHFDLKPENILLDGKMVPKIADFGLSRFIGEKNTITTMSPLGTLGYLPPEFVTKQIISKEYDIFSLGVIITKVMIGNMGYSSFADMGNQELIEHVHGNWRKRLQEIPMYPSLEADCKQVKRCIEIAVNCMEKDRRKRPTMNDIFTILDDIEKEQSNKGPLIEEFHNIEQIILSKTNTLGRFSQGWDDKANRESDPSVTRSHLPFRLLEEITNGFSEERIIDVGGYGVGYKGVLKNGKEIAVKRMHNITRLEDRVFQNELRNHMRLHHQNIVQLVGYCDKAEQIPVEYNGKIIFSQRVYRAICLEHMDKGSLEEHLSYQSCGLDWPSCYEIIRGTCEGLRYLHKGLGRPMYHLDLKPRNILLDKNMKPKIADFCLSWLLDGEPTQITQSSIGRGRTGCVPPEYIERGLISGKFDIFSLGIVIIKIIAGSYGHRKCFDMPSQEFIELVLRNWRKKLEAACSGISLEGYCQQVKKCIAIALECIELDRHKRPDILDIVQRLDETKTMIHGKDDPKLLDIHPLQLFFPFEPKGSSSCSLQLSNKGNDHIAFRLQTRSQKRCFTKLPLCGIVPPWCTYTLALTVRKQPPSDSEGAISLQSVLVRDQDLENLDQQFIVTRYEEFIKKAEETARVKVQEVALKVVCDPPAQQATSKPTQPEIKITATPDAKQVSSIEVHPTEPWIMTTHHGGHLRVWNYQTMAVLNSFEITDEPVHAAQFVVREKWIMAGDDSGSIHVYSYHECQGVTSFDAHDGGIVSLAVHPTDPYVLSSSDDDHLIKMWDWEKGWVCTRTFEGHCNKVSRVIFNPEDTSSFSSASWDGTVKIWNLNSDSCNTITLDEHTDGLVFVDYVTGGLWQHLITGSKDGTAAQIWDLNAQTCVKMLEGQAHHLSAVYCHPELPKVITGSFDGTVRTWDSITYRLENVIGFNLGAVYAFQYIKSLQRIVVGCHQGIAMMDINLL